MSKLYVACGIPGSGKSTYLANYVKEFYQDECSNMYKIVSRDAIRFSLLKEGDDYFSCEREVFNIFIKEIFNALREGKDCFADATHLTKASRKKLFNALLDYNKNHFDKGFLKIDGINAIYIDTPLEICLERNENRTGLSHVPSNKIEEMYINFQKPMKEEGFDNIIIINYEGKEI